MTSDKTKEPNITEKFNIYTDTLDGKISALKYI